MARPALVVDNDPMVGGLSVAERRIRDTASYINRRLSNMKAGEAWLDIGRELAELKTFLKKTSKHDEKRDGWIAAFKKETKPFPFSRRYADSLIDVYEKIGGTTVPPKSLPASAHALIRLSKLPDSHREQALKLCSPGTTATDVTRIAKEIGVPPSQKPKKNVKQKNAPRAKGETCPRCGLDGEPFDALYDAFMAALNQLPEDRRRDEIRNLARDIGVSDLLKGAS